MKETKRLTEQLMPYGDIHHIARITGYNVSYVRKVLNETRQNTLIHEVAWDIITMRKKLVDKYQVLGDARGVTERLEQVRRAESTLLLMGTRPVRKLMHNALKRLQILQDTGSTEETDRIIKEVSLYDAHIMELLEWLNGQRLYIDALLVPVDLSLIVREGAAAASLQADEHTIEVKNSMLPVGVKADSYLINLLVRSVLQQMLRMIGPMGRMVLSTKNNKEGRGIVITGGPCLVPAASVQGLNNPAGMLNKRAHADILEQVAVAGHFIMGQQQGQILWSVDEENVLKVDIQFNDKPEK
ncbi:hypothetical protein AB9P05_15675 [Roseivirga sp. BDSF3-8]|uniref:hypothetical protein n=1 Tax=Roseivirga sp. BDSF3-8 TaxID=3241598 RepID=UPI003531B1AB